MNCVWGVVLTFLLCGGICAACLALGAPPWVGFIVGISGGNIVVYLLEMWAERRAKDVR